ncbi:MAG TPA: GDP-mannose 4,6-dehydratase [Steroidobacteraceae bacterium]|nr:GDP-mannose 4,6-dehydratase [Steroidobacteraceae bacterium]
MRALICGVGGQDGAYLARLLLGKGYDVWGTSRDAQLAPFGNLAQLGIRDAVTLRSMAPKDFRSVVALLDECRPDELYLLAGQSSVGLSFEQPADTIESATLGVLNVMEAMRLLRQPVRLYHASSSECFGTAAQGPADERTPFAPRSPYAVAKASAHWLVATYREAYGLFACNGILFNHESPLRPKRFVTRKITSAAVRIAAGARERLALGRLDIVRDWGWAPEYVEAMWLMLQQPAPLDFVIATGESHSLEQFVALAFEQVGLDWRAHVDSDPKLFRPSDLARSEGNPARAERALGWRAQLRMPDVVRAMIAAESP